jgi:hypothetical protein
MVDAVGSVPHGVMGSLNYFFNFHTLLSCYSRLWTIKHNNVFLFIINSVLCRKLPI